MSTAASRGARLVDTRTRARLKRLAPAGAVVTLIVLLVTQFGSAETWAAAFLTVLFATAGLMALVAFASVYAPARRASTGIEELPSWVRPIVAFAMLTVVPIAVLLLAVPAKFAALLRRLLRRGEPAGTKRHLLGTSTKLYYARLSTWMWLTLAVGSTFVTLILLLDDSAPGRGALKTWQWEILLLASPAAWAGAVIAGGGPRGRTIHRQIGRGILTLLVLSVVVFLLMANRSAKDVAAQKFGNQITQGQIDAFAHEFRLDQPLHERYARWLADFARGDMGTSYVTSDSVAADVIPRFKKTLILAAVSLLISIPISVLIGVFQAIRIGRLSDGLLLIGSVVTAALPEFVIAIVLIFIFAVKLGWLPTDSSALVFSSGLDSDTVKAYILPTATIVVSTVPYMSRIARASVREALGAPYTQAALLRGLPRSTVVWDHAMRNAGIPLVNVMSINIVYLISGIVVVENVFAFPGVGQGIVQATQNSDLYKVAAFSVSMGAIFIVVSLIADMLVAYLNPRLRAAVAP